MRAGRWALLLALSAATASAAPVDVAVDPRVELLAVVRQLAGRGAPQSATGDYAARVEARFARFRSHPAVALYRDLALNPARAEAAASLPLYYGPPPELALKDPDADIHYVAGPGDAEQMQRLLHELRSFARESSFMAFFRDNRAFYAGLAERARRPLGKIEPVSVLERYLGISLSSRLHYYLTTLNADTHAFIVPYPLPPANAGAKNFDVYTQSPDLLGGSFSNAVWHEPLYVFVDPAFYYFEKLNVPDPEAFYGEKMARCRAVSPDCVKNAAVAALLRRLNLAAGVPALAVSAAAAAGESDPRLVDALAERLLEYESRRDLYPTLWDFLPRWFAVYEEFAFPGRAPRALAVPPQPKPRAASDFFDPKTTALMLREAPR